MFDEDKEVTSEEQQVLDVAERLKNTLYMEIDRVAHTIVEQSQKERLYTEEVESTLAILGSFGDRDLPLHKRVLGLKKKVEELERQIKETDDLLLAKKHYFPLIHHILKFSHDRGDQAMVNTVNEFLISGRLI